MKQYSCSLAGNRSGSGAGAVLIGAALMLVTFLTFITAVDYGLYSMKYKILTRGIDFAAASAVQEIDVDKSLEGLSGGYDEQSGAVALKGVFLDGSRANNVFFATVSANTGIEKSKLRSQLLTAVVSPLGDGLECTFYKEDYSEKIIINSPDMLEKAVNRMVGQLYTGESSREEHEIIFVNGNIKTNEFKERPYFLAFVRGYKINGLIKDRRATFACFAGARIERSN